ncbi:hypothetical protein [Sphingomonas hankookensis]|uniref:hypothetical protein n=1 Tax=Sphingomonas hankookensis TaxID=563996 RepID=UPI003B6848E0
MSDLFWLTDKQMQRIAPYFPLSHGVPRVCGSAWKRDPGSGVIGVEKGPLIPLV